VYETLIFPNLLVFSA